MKKLIILLSFFLFLSFFANAQSPESFSYQAVARDASGNILANQNISVRISILSDSTSGTVMYQESHGTTTSLLGSFNLQIGLGTLLQGSFSSIDWGSNAFFIKIEIDSGLSGTYVLMGTSQLLSVPYALYAKESGTPGPTGPSGADGTNGVDGADGATGPSGADGTNGVDGADGATGPSGADGTNGVDGADDQGIEETQVRNVKNVRIKCNAPT